MNNYKLGREGILDDTKPTIYEKPGSLINSNNSGHQETKIYFYPHLNKDKKED